MYRAKSLALSTEGIVREFQSEASASTALPSLVRRTHATISKPGKRVKTIILKLKLIMINEYQVIFRSNYFFATVHFKTRY